MHFPFILCDRGRRWTLRPFVVIEENNPLECQSVHCPAATVILYLPWFRANRDKHEKNSLDAFCTVSIKPRWTNRGSISEEERSQECRYLRYEIAGVNPSGTDLRRTVSTERDEGKRHRSNCMRGWGGGPSALRARHRAREEHFRVQKYSRDRPIVLDGPCALHPSVPCARGLANFDEEKKEAALDKKKNFAHSRVSLL